MKYENTLKTKHKKKSESYVNNLSQSKFDENYRYQLRSLIGKTVRIESTNYEVKTKTLESETGEYEVKEIVLKDAYVTRVKPYNNESLPIYIDHLWIMVGSDFKLESNYNKIRVDGIVNEYIKASGIKDIGLDAEVLELNNGKNIVVPKNYQGTTNFDVKDAESDEKIEIVCPDYFEHMVLNAKECEFLGLWKMYGWKTTADAPFSVVKSFGGPFKFTNLFDKITNLKYVDFMYSYLLNNEGKIFNINDLSMEERMHLVGNLKPGFEEVYLKKDFLKPNYYRYEYTVKDWNFNDIAYCLARTVNANTKNYEHVNCSELDEVEAIDFCYYHNLKRLAGWGFLEINEGHIGSYDKALDEYNKLVEEQKAKFEKLRKEYGDLEIQMKEIPKPVNKDYTYYYGVLTERGKNLLAWFGEEIPERVPLTSIPKKKKTEHERIEELNSFVWKN